MRSDNYSQLKENIPLENVLVGVQTLLCRAVFAGDAEEI